MSEGAAHKVADGDDRARRYFRVAHPWFVWGRRFDLLVNRAATPMIRVLLLCAKAADRSRGP